MLVKQLTRQRESFYLTFKWFLFFSETLGKKIKLKVTARGIKSVEHNGGIDNYILSLKSKNHTSETKNIKKNYLIK